MTTYSCRCWCAHASKNTQTHTKHKFCSYLDLGRNMDPSMNTDPDSSMYQQVDSSPVLRTKSEVSGQGNNLTNCNVQPHTQQVTNSFQPLPICIYKQLRIYGTRNCYEPLIIMQKKVRSNSLWDRKIVILLHIVQPVQTSAHSDPQEIILLLSYRCVYCAVIFFSLPNFNRPIYRNHIYKLLVRYYYY